MSDLLRCNDNITTIDKPHLTPAREKILEAMMNPEYLGLTTTEKCKRINVSRQAWYSALKDSEFMDIVSKTSIDLIKERIGDIVTASVKVATSSGARGFQDRQMLLKMAGLLVDKDSDNRIQIVNILQERGE